MTSFIGINMQCKTRKYPRLACPVFECVRSISTWNTKNTEGNANYNNT
jgi:hypothetical protein